MRRAIPAATGRRVFRKTSGFPVVPRASIRLATTGLSGGLIGLGDGVRFLHGPYARASVRCRFGQGTFARASGNDEDAPIAALAGEAVQPSGFDPLTGA